MYRWKQKKFSGKRSLQISDYQSIWSERERYTHQYKHTNNWISYFPFITKAPNRHNHTALLLLPAKGRRTSLHPIQGACFPVRPDSSGTRPQRETSGPGSRLYWPPCRLWGHCYLKIPKEDTSVNALLHITGQEAGTYGHINVTKHKITCTESMKYSACINITVLCLAKWWGVSHYYQLAPLVMNISDLPIWMRQTEYSSNHPPNLI